MQANQTPGIPKKSTKFQSILENFDGIINVVIF